MAKAATKKTTKTTNLQKSVARKPAKASAVKAAKPAKVPATKKGAPKKLALTKKAASVITKKATTVRAPVVSKDELRTQIEKLHGTIATLRAKNREANKALKTAEAKIAELEHQISQIEVKPVTEKPVQARKTRTRKAEATPVTDEETVEVVEIIEPADEPAGEDFI